MRRRLHRRTFLKLSTALAAAYLPTAVPTGLFNPAATVPEARLAVASVYPLPFPHRHFPNAEALLAQPLARFDLVLVPAYAAAELIRRGALRALKDIGPTQPALGRAHDPDGAFTLPYLTTATAILSRGPAPRSLEGLWRAEAVWPESARLVIGAALLRRGYPFNDLHSGRLAQIAEDLIGLRPRLASDPAAALLAGRADLALAPVPIHASPDGPRLADAAQGIRASLPGEGAALVEYDWAIPRGAANAPAALAYLARCPAACSSAPLSGLRLTPPAPLPALAAAQRDEIWSRVRRWARHS